MIPHIADKKKNSCLGDNAKTTTTWYTILHTHLLYVSIRIMCNNCDDPLTFHLVPSSDPICFTIYDQISAQLSA